MKTQLTKEQSNKLLSLGVPKEKASLKILFEDDAINLLDIDDDTEIGTPIFTLTDLIDLLPKEITLDSIEHALDFGWDQFERQWFAQYVDEDSICDFIQYNYFSDDLIDALYHLVVQCIEGYYICF